jgi:hypothetical protein
LKLINFCVIASSHEISLNGRTYIHCIDAFYGRRNRRETTLHHGHKVFGSGMIAGARVALLTVTNGAVSMGKVVALMVLTLAIISAPVIASAQNAATPRTRFKQEQVPPRPVISAAGTATPAVSCSSLIWIFFSASTASPRCACSFSSCSSPLVLGIGF